ncbi:iron-containing alcohol dehydrogenase [Oceanicella sp. SM1341]|uniref:iron-containing alcohol dehydrogenase n=1 Tax=Oceanicella sp. SM1341 TaxID=1548889 RepID=UPI000E469B8B|nr:iron-containing alcohol dehydrogenase [Oceanicella sp. SM1341]
MTVSQFHFLNRVVFGPGAAETLGEELTAAGIRRPLLVSDEGLVAAGLVARLRGLMPAPAAEFLAVPANPTEAAVAQARALCLEAGCDGIVALGGGSPIDFAKAVALSATHPGPLGDYAAIRGGAARIGPCLPVIVLPTTAGTGSEVGRGALITLETGEKLVIASPHLLPVVALCDPGLTLGLPPGLTAATGVDALSHCIEAWLSPRWNPPVDAIVLDGLRRGWAALPRAVAAPDDIDARAGMMMVSIEGGLGFQKGLGAVHALSHPLGALPGLSLHHGSCNAAVMPAVLRFNRPAAQARLEALEEALALPAGTTLADALEGLNARLGLPCSLREMGVRAEMIPGLTVGALADHSRPTNPRPLGEAEITALYTELVA